MIFEMFGPLNPATTQDSIHPNYLVASELKDPICHSDECQIGSFSSEATILWSGLCQWYGSTLYLV